MALQGEYEPSSWEWVRNQVAEYEASGGTRATTLRGSSDPIVVITSVGAKSGRLRKNPVMKVERDGKYVAVASKGGAPEHPTWYHNFLEHPVVDLQDGPEPKSYRARLLSGAERADWWEYAVATWSTYASYQEKTDREIPVFLLEPLDD
jgi:deazaflavin-dependent oxidoreductase (nitroreductase family)